MAVGSTDRLFTRLLSAGWVCVATPIALTAVSAWRSGWVPAGDAAIVSAKVMDSTTTDPPLVGGWTSLGRLDDEPLHHAGPIALWIIALPAKAFGAPGGGLVLGAALLAVASIAFLAVCVRRWSDRSAEVILLGLVALMVSALGGDRLSDPNAPYVGVLPLLLFLVASVGVVLGHHRQLWVVIGAGSIAAQTHLGYVPLVVVFLVIVAGRLFLDGRRDVAVGRRLIRRTVPIGLAIGGLAWIGPIIDQIVGTQNLTRLVEQRLSSDEPSVGVGRAFDLAVDAMTIPGGWMIRRAQEGTLPNPDAVQTVLAGVAATALVATVVWARRRSEPDLVAVSALGLVAVLVAIVSSASVTAIPLGEGLLYYRLFWWPVAVLFSFGLIMGGLRVVQVAFPATVEGFVARIGPGPRPARAGALCAVFLALVLVPFGTRPADEQDYIAVRPVADHAAAVAAIEPSPTRIELLLDEPTGGGSQSDQLLTVLLAPTLIAELRLEGIDVRFPVAEFDSSIGPIGAYAFDHPVRGDEDLTILFRTGTAAADDAPPGFRFIGSRQRAPVTAEQFPTAVLVSEN